MPPAKGLGSRFQVSGFRCGFSLIIPISSGESLFQFIIQCMNNSSVNTQELVQLLSRMHKISLDPRNKRASLFSAAAHTLGFYRTFEGRVPFGIIPQPRRVQPLRRRAETSSGWSVCHPTASYLNQYRHTHSRRVCVHCGDRRTRARIIAAN